MAIMLEFSEYLTSWQKNQVLNSRKFQNYLAKLSPEFDITKVLVDRVYWFGHGESSKPGYIMVSATGTTHDGRNFPGNLTLIRGDSVAVLVVLEAPDGLEYTVLARQPRIAAGKASYEEIPAGMIDEGQFSSKALDELSEEIGVDLGVKAEDLVPLDSFQPSAGGCDETLQIYFARKKINQDVLDSLRGRIAGNQDEGEEITVEVILFDDLATRATADGKSRMAYYGYCASQGRVPAPPKPFLEARSDLSDASPSLKMA